MRPRSTGVKSATLFVGIQFLGPSCIGKSHVVKKTIYVRVHAFDRHDAETAIGKREMFAPASMVSRVINRAAAATALARQPEPAIERLPQIVENKVENPDALPNTGEETPLGPPAPPDRRRAAEPCA
jgi:hypothetical protein